MCGDTSKTPDTPTQDLLKAVYHFSNVTITPVQCSGKCANCSKAENSAPNANQGADQTPESPPEPETPSG